MMDGQAENVTQPIVIDIVIILLLGLFDFYVAKVAKPFKRGFFCDDETITYTPYSSTVPSTLLNVVGISVPLMLILLVEWKVIKKNRNMTTPYKIFNHRISFYQWNVYKMLACYASGALFSQTLTDIGKKVIGRLRPNFLQICNPEKMLEICNKEAIESKKYIPDCVCLGGYNDIDPDKSRVSFPSGHSSFSFYVAVFLVIYLQKRWKTRTTLLKPVVQFTIIALAWFVALSRVMNNKHHWSDVLAGMLLGSSVAIINSICVQKIFSKEAVPLSIANTNGNGTSASNIEVQAQL